MNALKRIWRYFFPRRLVDPPPIIESIRNKPIEFHEFDHAVFFEPVTPKQIFDDSDNLDDFIKKITK